MKESIEVRTPKTRIWKPKRAETIDGKPTTRNTKSKTNKLWPNQGDAVPNISWNLRKKRSNQYWLEQPTMPWEATEQLKTHKPDLQQIPYNLIGEEGKKNKRKMWVFFRWWWEAPHTRNVTKYIDGEGSSLKYGERAKNFLKIIIFKNMKKI